MDIATSSQQSAQYDTMCHQIVIVILYYYVLLSISRTSMISLKQQKRASSIQAMTSLNAIFQNTTQICVSGSM